MYLCTVRVGEWLYKPVSIELVFSNILSKSSTHCFIEPLGLTLSPRMLRYSGELLDAKKSTYCCKEFRYKLRAVIRKEEKMKTVRYDPVVKEDVCYMRRCYFKRRNSPS